MKGRMLLLSMAAVFATAGCATKGHVARSIEPVQTQVDELAAKTGKHDEQIKQANEEIAKNRTEIGVTKEVANAAGTRANEANSKAEAAGNASQQNSKDIEALRNTISNIEDFSVAKEVQVSFGFDKDTLSPDAQKQLDDLASQKPENGARYFLAIEGFADPIGDAEYNYQLSQRRADRVLRYLVTKHEFPVYRIYNVGLGEDKLADEGKGREARAKNRRVEIRLYTAGEAAQQKQATPSPSARNNNPSN